MKYKKVYSIVSQGKLSKQVGGPTVNVRSGNETK